MDNRYNRIFKKEKVKESSVIKGILSHLKPSKLLPEDKPYDFGYDIGKMIKEALNQSRFKSKSKEFFDGIKDSFK